MDPADATDPTQKLPDKQVSEPSQPPAPTPPQDPIADIPIVDDPIPGTTSTPAQPPPAPPTPVDSPDVSLPHPEIAPPEPEPEPEPEPPKVSSDLPAVAKPAQPAPLDLSSIDISQLSPDQLRQAAALHAKLNQRTISQAGVAARRATASKNLAAITTYVSGHRPTSSASIARALNLPPRRVSHYLQILTKNGTVTATGWAQSRRYTIR